MECVRFCVLFLASLSLALSAEGGNMDLGPQQAVAESSGASIAPPAQQFPGDTLRARFSRPPPTGIGSETFAFLDRFYASRSYAPLWTNVSGLNPTGEALLGRLRRIAAARRPSPSPALSAVAGLAQAYRDEPPTELEPLLSAALVDTAVDPDDPAAIGTRPQALGDVANADSPLAVLQDLLPVARRSGGCAMRSRSIVGSKPVADGRTYRQAPSSSWAFRSRGWRCCGSG